MKLLSKNPFNITIKDTYLETLIPRFKEERIGAFLTLALTLLTITIFGIFAISPTLTTITQLRKKLDDNTFVFQKLEEKKTNLITLQQKHTQIQDRIPFVLSAIPDLPQIPQFAAQVQGIADTSQVQLLNIQTLPVTLPPDTSEQAPLSFAFSLTATGSFTRLHTFIKTLQSFERLLTIDEFSFVQTFDGENSFQLTAKGKTYFQKL